MWLIAPPVNGKESRKAFCVVQYDEPILRRRQMKNQAKKFRNHSQYMEVMHRRQPRRCSSCSAKETVLGRTVVNKRCVATIPLQPSTITQTEHALLPDDVLATWDDIDQFANDSYGRITAVVYSCLSAAPVERRCVG